ncbi:beta-glycosyl hydrolase [hydrothermal vent metagenome]|uniref:beta-N-acetylhexosaminidase n=1 Tax=hydrothermal vent metagenome TaxID=652676 RepID=A0A3B0U4Z7_9ZZZZ
MSTKQKLAILLIGVSSIATAQETAIIPKPSNLQIKQGEFILGQGNTLEFNTSDKNLSRIAGFFNEYLELYYGFKLSENGKGKPISLKITTNDTLGSEGYRLNVGREGIFISANKPAGVFYGIQTLKQLLPVETGSKGLPIPAVEIEDTPRFQWRGNMLDVGRHFFPVSFIKKYIDILAMYKLNIFHWHLTEDQGWRIEIKKYPELIEISHWRDQTVVGHARWSYEYDGIGYGGFYTRGQVKDIVKYAADRFITVVPEIEMPGHSSAALAAYPGLGCTGGPYKVQERWGIFEDVYCAGKEETFKFLQDVLDEVCELFPSRFIHIGGDECPKKAWEKCPDCQKRIKDEGLKNEHELQSYFISRMDKYLTSKGKRLIGWDEILEGGLAPQATVMSWRGIKGGVEAAKQGHDVVMTPTTNLYFDYYQSQNRDNEPLAIGGFLPLEKVYSYEPVPEELTPEEAKHILGAQANLWTEYVATTKKAEYMLLPRLCALAELAWTPKEGKDYTDFLIRLDTDYKRLEMAGINFRNHHKK